MEQWEQQKNRHVSKRTVEEIQNWMVAQLADGLGMSTSEIDTREPYTNFGLDSATAVVLSGDLSEWLDQPLSPTLLWDYPTIEELAEYLAGEPTEQVDLPSVDSTDKIQSESQEPIAIVGIGCRFPGANGPQAFWQLLCDETDMISEVPMERWNKEEAALGSLRKTGMRYGAFLSNLERFDARFFGISPREAERMDPQQRLLAEVAWEAIEDAGWKAESLKGSQTGVFIGVTSNDYSRMQKKHPETLEVYDSTGNSISIVSNRLSYMFDFRGPSLSVDTACSSSLVAVHLACRSIWSGELTTALAGGVNVILVPDVSIGFAKANIFAPDGRCKTFDETANGYVRGEGIGVVVLKSYEQAVADGDDIYAIIRGSAVNQDGRSNGLTAPNQLSQEMVLRDAYRNAKVAPEQVQYVEAHGTGTVLGDPIEAKALGKVLGAGRKEGQQLVIGSVKTNIGHLESAAGIAGLIKVALSIKHGQIPRSLHFQNWNPLIPHQELGLHVQKSHGAWPSDSLKIAGVSSFGFGGTNAHVVLAEAPQEDTLPRTAGTSTSKGRPMFVSLSAKHEAGVPQLAQAYRDFLLQERESSDRIFQDFVHSVSLRRDHHDYRAAIVAPSPDELLELLDHCAQGVLHKDITISRRASGQRSKIVFVFSGQGPEWSRARELLENEPVFREAVFACDKELLRHTDWSLVEELLADEQHSHLDQMVYVQPVYFAIQVGLVALWRSWGIVPDAVIGHSVGEVAAAYVAGTLTLPDAIRVIYNRGKFTQGIMGQGAMVAVGLSLSEAEQVISGNQDLVSVAVHNGPTSCVLSGDPHALEAIMKSLQEKDVFHRIVVAATYASHSPQVQPILADFQAALQSVQPQSATIELYSTVTGGRIDGREVDATYWGRNLREMVSFYPVIDQLSHDGYEVFVEISPHPLLVGVVKQILQHRGIEGCVIPSIRRDEQEQMTLLNSLGALYTIGVPVQWDALVEEGAQFVRLPRYPWQHESYWIPAENRYNMFADGLHQQATGEKVHPLLHHQVQVAALSSGSVWETVLGLKDWEWVGGHRLQGTPVFPGAAYIEMALEGSSKLYPERTVEVHNLQFKKALFLSDKTVLQVQLAAATDQATFRFYGKPAGNAHANGDWSVHAEGEIVPAKARTTVEDTELFEIDSIKARCHVEMTGDAFYQNVQESGVDYSRAYQGVVHLWRGNNEALGQIMQPEDLMTEAEAYHFHPALLDACLQVMLAAIPEHQQDQVYMPSQVEKICWRPSKNSTLWCHVQLRSDLEADGHALVGDLLISDEIGNQVAEISGFRLQSLQQSERRTNEDEMFYEIRWEVQQVEATAQRITTEHQGTWLIFADTQGVGQKLADALETEQEQTIVVEHGKSYQKIHDNKYVIRPNSSEDYRRLHFEALAAGDICRGVIHMWSLDAQTESDGQEDSLEAAHLMGSASVVHLIQQMTERGGNTPPRFWLVTRGAQAVGTETEPIAVQQAPLWGLGTTMRIEHLELWGGLIDLDPVGSVEQNVTSLLEAVRQTEGADRIAYREGLRYEPRLVELETESQALFQCHPDRAYLITGGLGDLGLVAANWLIDQGARRMILMGRSKLPTRSEWVHVDPDSRLGGQISAIKGLEMRGASVHLAEVDVTDFAQLTHFYSQYQAEGWPPIRGIIHAAGLAEDQTLLDMQTQDLLHVMRPKVTGAWHLHHLFRDQPLDFFTMFSSLSSYLSSPRLASYAAANAFLDALAHHRQALGLPAMSINWGPWEEVGMLTRSDRGSFKTSNGMNTITPAQGTELMSLIFRQRNAQLSVVDMDWHRWNQVFPYPRSLSFYEHLLDHAGASEEVAGTNGFQVQKRQEFLDTPTEHRVRFVEKYLLEHLSRVLKIAEANLDSQASINGLGLDSMMGVELKARIETELGVVLPIAKLLQGYSTLELAEQIVELAEAGSFAASPVLVNENVNQSTYSLSQGQKSLWFLQQMHTNSGAYNVCFSMCITSEIEPLHIKRAFQMLVERHATLRTSFHQQEETLEQVVHPDREFEFTEVDLSRCEEREIHEVLYKESLRPFDLQQDPLLRVIFYRRTEEESYLLVVLHHVIVDLWGLAVLIDEFKTAYAAISMGEEPMLPALPLQFGDFVRWQEDLLAGPEGERQECYWLQELAGELPVLRLPFDKPRPQVQTHQGDTHFFSLGTELSERLQKMIREKRVTLFTFLLASYQLMLRHWTGQTDILVGSPSLGRARAEFQSIIGHFVNTLVYRADVADNLAFEDFLDQVRVTVLNGLDHQEYPFNRLVETLQPDRDLGVTPIYQTQFALQRLQRSEEMSRFFMGNDHDHQIDFGGMQVKPFPLPQAEGQIDIFLEMGETEGLISGWIKYSSDLFYPETIASFAAQFNRLLEEIVNQPEAKIGELLAALTERERREELEKQREFQANRRSKLSSMKAKAVEVSE